VVQQRLAALHYDTGAVNGTFSYDTTHAVIAFEKVQGLTRDGVVSSAVLKALAKPVVPRAYFPIAGREFEVNKSRQVVLMVEGGQITRILDASTGFGGNYVYAGVTYQAITPEGNYTIQRKINGVRVSHLGVLYRPAYFFEGYAIHGEGLVPVYPASHGCVRITVPAMDRLYDLLAGSIDDCVGVLGRTPASRKAPEQPAAAAPTKAAQPRLRESVDARG